MFTLTGEYRIYCHEEIETGKKYVGLTGQPGNSRLRQHIRGANYPAGKSIPLFGLIIIAHGIRTIEDFHKHFTTTILEEGLTHVDAKVREQYWIEFYDSWKNGYNSTKGGELDLTLNGVGKMELFV